MGIKNRDCDCQGGLGPLHGKLGPPPWEALQWDPASSVWIWNTSLPFPDGQSSLELLTPVPEQAEPYCKPGSLIAPSQQRKEYIASRTVHHLACCTVRHLACWCWVLASYVVSKAFCFQRGTLRYILQSRHKSSMT